MPSVGLRACRTGPWIVNRVERVPLELAHSFWAQTNTAVLGISLLIGSFWPSYIRVRILASGVPGITQLAKTDEYRPPI